jgi:hypothetical protein
MIRRRMPTNLANNSTTSCKNSGHPLENFSIKVAHSRVCISKVRRVGRVPLLQRVTLKL